MDGVGSSRPAARARFTRLARLPVFTPLAEDRMGFRSFVSRRAGRQRKVVASAGLPQTSAGGRAALRVATRTALETLEGRLLFAVFAVTDLGTLGGLRSEAHAINASGQVALDADVTPG